MKNVVLGVMGGFMLLYMAIIGLTIFGIQSRENELKNCLSGIVFDELKLHYVPPILRQPDYEPTEAAVIEKEIQQELQCRITSDSQYVVELLACDMEKGLLSVQVVEAYQLPNGKEKKWQYTKTAMIE